MALSPTVARYGNPAERAEQGRQKQTRISRLMELEKTQGGLEDAATARGPFATGLAANDSRGYAQMLNRKGEIASLNSELAGDGPGRVQHSYGGTEFAMGPATQALQRRANPEDAPGDNLDYYGRLASVQGAQAGADRQRTAAFRESTANDPVFEARRRGMAAEDTVSAGRAKGAGEAAGYFAPGQDAMRRADIQNDEERSRRLAPYQPAAIRGDATRYAADAGADSRGYVADTNRTAGNERSRINSLGRVAGSITGTPDEQNRRANEAMGTLQPRPGASSMNPSDPSFNGEPTPERVFPRARLAEFARVNGMTEQEAEQEILARQYTIR